MGRLTFLTTGRQGTSPSRGPSPPREQALSEYGAINFVCLILNRVLFITAAFAIGVDCPHIRKVVHTGVPSTMEEYFQESGRAGRDGNLAVSKVLFNSEIITAKKNVHQVMRMFVTTTSYRRRVILQYFGFTCDGDCIALLL